MTNNWWRVHNFTPESAKFTLTDLILKNSKNEYNENNLVNFSLNELLFKEFLLTPKNNFNLTFSLSKSHFFHVEHNKLVQPNEVKKKR